MHLIFIPYSYVIFIDIMTYEGEYENKKCLSFLSFNLMENMLF